MKKRLQKVVARVRQARLSQKQAKDLVVNGAFFGGTACIVHGIALYSEALGWIAAGVFILFFAVVANK